MSSSDEATAYADAEDMDQRIIQPCVHLPMAVLETEYSVGYVFYPPAHCDFHCEVRLLMFGSEYCGLIILACSRQGW